MQSKERIPQDLVAIFHASFHPTKGSLIDWSLKASDDLDLSNVEFSCLPSGLHLVQEDVVYFSKDSHQGVCVFRRRKTTEHGHRGFRLSSLGILLAKSARPRPWRHVAALKQLVHRIYSVLEDRRILEPTVADWEPAREFFDQRKVCRADLGGAGDWNGWSHEFDGSSSDPFSTHPTIHLPHLLRILGPSSLTLYKHILGRQRILIFTLPPVEASCILCQVAADLCLESQVDSDDGQEGDRPGKLTGKSQEGVKVLGMVTLNDLDKLHQEGQTGRGWIACTTDAIFLEKPSYYDLIIDLTTSTPSKATRPTFYTSRPNQPSSSKGPSHRLSAVRFTWSDVKLWTELDRILEIDATDRGPAHRHVCCEPGLHTDSINPKSPKLPPAWTDVWRIYEDVCLVCAGLWLGAWRNNSTMSYSTVSREGSSAPSNWGSVRLDGDDDLTVGGSYVRNVGMGIEGRPATADSGEGSSRKPKSLRRNSGMSLGTLKDKKRKDASMSSAPPPNELDARLDRDVLTTMALLQTFHANTRFLLSRLATYLPSSDADAIPSSIVLTPRDILSFELGPLSSLDARFIEWLTEEYGGGVRVTVRKGWRDFVGLVLGLG